MKIHFIARLLAFTLLVICAISCKKKALDDTTLLSQHWNVVSYKINGVEQINYTNSFPAHIILGAGAEVDGPESSTITSFTSWFTSGGSFKWNIKEYDHLINAQNSWGSNLVYYDQSFSTTLPGSWSLINSDKQLEITINFPNTGGDAIAINSLPYGSTTFDILELNEKSVILSGLDPSGEKIDLTLKN